jgi:hypothetical protein
MDLPLSSVRVLLIALLTVSSTTSLAARNRTSAAPSASKNPTAAHYGDLPLSFEANQGQADQRVEFLARTGGYSIFLTADGAVLSFGKAGNCDSTRRENGPPGTAVTASLPGPRRGSCAINPTSFQDVFRMNLEGAGRVSHVARAIGEEQLPGKVNYFLGKDPTHWRTNLPTYAKVHYSGVYPGVDLVYYGSQRQLEYDFVVAPGADASPIRLQFAGGKQPRIDAGGALVIDGVQGKSSLPQAARLSG